MWSNKYIGIPFLDKGRDINGIDCWGLARLIYKQEYSIDLPSFSSDYEPEDTDRMQDLIAQYREGWEPVDTPTEGCLVLFKVMGVDSHIGVAISNTHFIHSRDGMDSAIESLESFNWNKRIVGYYKYSENKSSILNVVPHPLRTERFVVPILPGTNLDELAKWIKTEYKIADEIESRVHILVNGIVIAQDKWSEFTLQETDKVEYRAVPGKGNTLRLILVLALVIAAPYIANFALGGSIGVGVGAAGGVLAGSPFLASLAVAGVTMVGTALINVISPVRPPSSGSAADPGSTERQLMVNGGNNRGNPYGAIPVILGKVRLTPPLGAFNNLTFEKDVESYLTMLLVWGYAPLIIDTATLQIGNVPIAEYEIPKLAIHDGRQSKVIAAGATKSPYDQNIDDIIAIYGKDYYTVNQNITLACAGIYDAPLTGDYVNQATLGTFGPFTTASSGPPQYNSKGELVPITHFTMSFHFPQGLRRIPTEEADAGKPAAAYVKYETQIKIGNGGWTLWENSEFGDGTPKKDAFTINKTYYNLNSTQEVQVRVRRKTGADPEWPRNIQNGNVKNNIFAQVTLLQTVFVRNTYPVEFPLNSDIALTAIKIKANDQLNGNIEGINAIVQTWGPSWNGTSWVDAAINNPAALFLYVLKHPANPQRIKEADVASKINLQQIQYWHQYCAFKGFEYNSVLASQRSILEVLRDICAAGRASPAMIDGKWTVVIDEPKTNIVQHFTPHNSWGFEAIKSLPKLPDALKVNYFDEAAEYQESELIIYNFGKHSGNAELFETISLPGVTKKSIAIDHARWHFAQAKLRPEVYKLNCDIEYLVCNRGDRVKVMHDVPMWGIGSGRVKTKVNTTTFVLDEPVFVETGKPYTIRFRTRTGASIERNLVTTWTVAGYISQVTLSESTSDVNEEDLFMFGEYHKESQDLIIISIETSSNKSALITMIDYGVTDTYNLFTGYSTLTASTIFESNMTLPSEYARNGFRDTDVPTITQIVSDDSAAKLVNPSTLEHRISVSYVNPQNLPKGVAFVQCSYYLSTPNLINATVISTDYNAGVVNITGVSTGETYKIKLRYVTTDNRLGSWTAESTHVVGSMRNYGNVEQLFLDVDSKFLIMKPIATVNPSMFKSFEYRIQKNTGSADFWEVTPSVANGIKVVKATGTGQIDLTEFSTPRLSEAGVTYRVACRTLDINGAYSSTSLLGNIVLKTIQTPD
jgi:hypothetical protein